MFPSYDVFPTLRIQISYSISVVTYLREFKDIKHEKHLKSSSTITASLHIPSSPFFLIPPLPSPLPSSSSLPLLYSSQQ